MAQEYDVLVIGAGMAGASAGAEVSAHAKVAVLEREERPGYHSTGRSAAVYIANYGNTTIRKLNRASRPFYDNPPPGFSENPLLTPQGLLYLARPGCEHMLQEFLDESNGIEEISPAQALTHVPVLRAEMIARAAFEVDVMAMDVDSIHQGYLRLLKRNQGQVICNAEVKVLQHHDGIWQVETPVGTFSAPIVVNAAGAWADQIATLAGAEPVGLTPLRRSAAIVVPPAGVAVEGWPLGVDCEETYYFKPEAGKLLVSPSDETPVEPHDAFPDDLDLAEGIDRFEQAVNFEVTHVEHRWAGLRTFAPDRSTVVGFDPDVSGFFWLAGQGGYGIQTAPAMAELAASLIRGAGVPVELAAQDFSAEEVSPARFKAS